MAQDDELRRRLEELERENRRLKEAAAGKAKEKVIRYSLGHFKGSPTISFEVNGRHFTLGVRKAAIALRCTEPIKKFVSQHDGELNEWTVIQDQNSGCSGSDDDSRI